MKYEYKKLPRFILCDDDKLRVYDYDIVLVPIPETESEAEVLEE